jgi:hypothetical protein
VLPGRYIAKLTVTGKEQSQSVDVRPDPRAHTTPAALASRHAMSMRIAELSEVYSAAAKAFGAVNGELERLAASVKAMPNAPAGADSAVTAAARTAAELRPRFSPSYGTPIGRAFDLLGALQSSSGAPTEAEGRILDSATGELRETITRLNGLITTTLPAVRSRVGALAVQTEAVRLP